MSYKRQFIRTLPYRLAWVAAMVLLVWALAACSVTRYEREGASREDFHMDDGQCRAQAGQTPVGRKASNVYHACMRGKGWHRVKNQ